MVQIGVLDSDENSQKEYVLVELQGEIEKRDDKENTSPDLIVGQLSLKDNNKALLVIGHQNLEGQVQELKKPLAYIERTNDDSTLYQMKAMISKKLVFKSRPINILE